MNFLLLLGGIVLLVGVFAIGPLVGVLHVFFRGDWQPIGRRNVIWALLMLIPLVWILYFVLYLLLGRRNLGFGDDELGTVARALGRNSTDGAIVRTADEVAS